MRHKTRATTTTTMRRERRTSASARRSDDDDDATRRPPSRVFLLVDVSSKARDGDATSIARTFAKRFLTPRCVVRDDDDFKRNGGGRVDAIRKRDGRRERRRGGRRVATIQTRFCARFYDASTTPSRMDAFVKKAIVMLEREEEETSTKTTTTETTNTNTSFGRGNHKRIKGEGKKKKKKNISASSAAIGHFRSITAESVEQFLRLYDKLTEILDESDEEKTMSNRNGEERSEFKRKKKRERFGNFAKYLLQALADMEKPDEDENEEEDVDDDEDDGDAIATSAFVDDYENGESDEETSDSDDADERDDGIGGIAESDEDEDEDDLDEDEDEEKYAMLVVLANMDGNNDDIAEMNVKLERHGEHKIDREIFSGFRGVEAQLKRENIRAHCLRLTSSYSASNDGNTNDVREYVELFRDIFGGCAARADTVTSAIGTVPSCWLLNDFLPNGTVAKKSYPTLSTTAKETKETKIRTTEIFVQSRDGREDSLSTASSTSENFSGVKQITIKGCLDRSAVCFSSLDYAKTMILKVNDGNGEGLLLTLGVKNAYAECDIIAEQNSNDEDAEREDVANDSGEQRVLAVLKPLSRTSFSLTPARTGETEIFREVMACEEGVRNVRQQQHQQQHRYSLELVRNAFSLINEGKPRKLRACEDISRLFQLTLGGSKWHTPPPTTTTHTATTTTTTTTSTNNLNKHVEEDDQSLNIPSSQRTTSTTFEEAKEHFDADGMEEDDDNEKKRKDEIANNEEEDRVEEYYSSAFADLTQHVTPRDNTASMPIVERLEKWYGVEMNNKKRSFASLGAAATGTAGMRLLASISRCKQKHKESVTANDTSSMLLDALDARFENEFISVKRSSDARFDGMIDYEDPRSPEKFTRVRGHSNAFDLPKSPPSAIKRKKKTFGASNGGAGLLSPSKMDRKKRQQTTTRDAAAVNFEAEDDGFSPKKTFKSPRRKVAKSTHPTPEVKNGDTKIGLWTVGPEPECFNAAKEMYVEFIETKCAKSKDERDPDLGEFSRKIVKKLAVSLAKRRCVLDKASNVKAWGEILRETMETLCVDRKELKTKYKRNLSEKGLKRREYLIQIHIKLTLHALRSIKGDKIPFIANMKPVTGSAPVAKEMSRKRQEIQEDSASAKETAKAVTKLVEDIFFLLDLEKGTKDFLESDVEPYYGKFCPECIGMILHNLNVSTKLTSRYQVVVGKNANGKEDKSAATRKSGRAPFSLPPAKKNASSQQQTAGLRRSPRKLGGDQTNVNNTALALVNHHQPSTSSASSAFQQQTRIKVLKSVKSNKTRVVEQKPLSPRTKAAQKRRQNETSRLQMSNRDGANNGNYTYANAMVGGLNTVPKNRFAKNTGASVSRNGDMKPRQLTHAFSQQPLQTPLPPSKNIGITRGGGDRFAVHSTPLSYLGGGVDSTPRRVPDTNNNTAVVESTPMQSSGGGGGGRGGTSSARRRSRPSSGGGMDANNNNSYIIEQTPLETSRRPKFTPASGGGNNRPSSSQKRRKQELEEVVAETPPTKHATTRSGRLVQAALDNNSNKKKNQQHARNS